MPTVDITNERVVLSQAFLDEERCRYIVGSVKPGAFRGKGHQKIMWCIGACVERGMKPTVDSVAALCAESPYEENVDPNMDSLDRLVSNAIPMPIENIAEHVRRINEDRLRVDLSNQDIPGILSDLEKGSVPMTDIAARLRRLEEDVSTRVGSSRLELRDMREIEEEYRAFTQKRWSGEGFYPTGYGALDDVLVEGLAPGKVSVWAGRTSMGKSTFVYNMMLRLSRGQVHSSLFSLEMPTMSVMDKFVAARSGIDLMRLVKQGGANRMSEAERGRLLYQQERLANIPHIYIDDRAAVTLDYIRDQVRRLQARLGVKYMVVMIDLFGKIRDIRAEYQAGSYEEQLNRVQRMARELGVHFALVAQIRRRDQVKNFWLLRPTLTEIKNSGAWEEVADLVVFFFRARYYNSDLPEDVLEVHVAKQRMGPKDETVYFEFDGPLSRVSGLDGLIPYDKRSREVGGGRQTATRSSASA